ncbi:hypothetical protein [Snodgrassella communis]|jgi:hypothetical protein|uniref:hypothetical protein n=1 Tax=Snodgrassella communis TaxID=2946699 RepID=UPI000C1DD2C5|nr:hypothetical protein [Snodgrassella communis]PIT08993.1 hypothetical protein BGI31_06695 [Snodgrassella communis]
MNHKQIDLLEVISDKKNSNSEIESLMKGLLVSPWCCPNELIDKYVTKSLAQILKQYQKYVCLIISRKKKFHWFKIDFAGIGFSLYDKITKEKVNFLSQLIIYQESIREDLEKEKIDFNTLATYELGALVGLYIYATMAIYDVAGIIENQANPRSKVPFFVIKPLYLNAYYLTVFRIDCNHQSKLSDHTILMDLFREANIRQLYKNSQDLIHLSYLLIDKKLSINIRYLSSCFYPAFQKLLERVQLLIYLYHLFLCSQQNCIPEQSILINMSQITNSGFSIDEIENLIDDKGHRTGFYNTILERTSTNGILTLKGFDLKYAFTIHTKNQLDQFLRTQDNWFEKSYVIPYLQNEMNSNRFIIGNGFKRSNKYKEQLPNYDVDVVIYDKKTDIFYFCQIKHRLMLLMTSFRDTVKKYNSPFIKEGVNQLIALKKFINEEVIKQQIITAFQNTSLTKTMIEKKNFSRSSRFLVLHNLEDFDFCTCQNVTMFEWNTFRNLLKGRISTIYNKDEKVEMKEIYKELIIDFADLDAVKTNHLTNKTEPKMPFSRSNHLELKIYRICEFKVFNKRIFTFKKIESIVPYFT